MVPDYYTPTFREWCSGLLLPCYPAIQEHSASHQISMFDLRLTGLPLSCFLGCLDSTAYAWLLLPVNIPPSWRGCSWKLFLGSLCLISQYLWVFLAVFSPLSWFLMFSFCPRHTGSPLLPRLLILGVLWKEMSDLLPYYWTLPSSVTFLNDCIFS